MRARTPLHASSALDRVAATLLLAALAACSGRAGEATESAPVQASAPVGPESFALRAQRGARIQEGAEVMGGDVGVVLPADAPSAQRYPLRLDTHAAVGGGARLIAPAVRLARRAVAGEVLTDRLDDRGSTHGAVSPFVTVPPVQPLAAVAAGGPGVTVSPRKGRTLSSGAYGDVVVEPRAILRLEGGEYDVASLSVAPGGTVIALATSRVRVAARLDAGSDTRLAIADGGSARDLRIEVAGADATSTAADVEGVETPAARIGERSTVRALISVPMGALVVGARASIQGAVVANAVLVRARASIGFEDGFEPLTCLGGCDDGNACTADECVVGECRHEPLAAGAACSDGNVCNGEEMCNGEGACLAGVALAVDDGNPCTADACDATIGVSHLPLAAGASCTDSNACNGVEICDGAGACLAGIAPAIDDGNPCTEDACDATTGVSHLPLAAGASCTDSNACNGEETCDGAGTCLAGVAPAVDDGNSCTADACDATTGVSHLPLAAGTSCTDANACNGLEICDGAGACLGIAPAIDDGNPCTADACDATSGVSHLPLAAGTSCTDANACNGVEICDAAGACLAGVAPVVDDGDPCTTDACDATGGVIHVPIAGCVPPPSFAEEIAYLYSGAAPIQKDVQPGAIEPDRAAVVRGRVFVRNGGPLAGVRVDVFDHAELGWTLTRADGAFDLAVNGGAGVVLEYEKVGRPVVQRSIDVTVHEYTTMPDVALVPYDSSATPIGTPNAGWLTWPQVAFSSRAVDTNGARETMLVFAPLTKATMTLPDGRDVALEMPFVRATEYTVGPGGPQALPALLPPSVSYLYAVELSVDEAVVAGAEVAFAPPVAVYVQNYRGFAVGSRLPAAFYDRSIAAWLSQSDGRVVAMVGITLGLADLDVDGDGRADDASTLSALGITRAEREMLAIYYLSGQTFWRAAVRRFGAMSCGQPPGVP